MTAYRSAPFDDRPYVNPSLERALLEYYRDHRRHDVRVLMVSLAIVLVAGCWALVAKHEYWWMSMPSAFGVCGMFGVGFNSWRLASRRPQLLIRIQTGIAIQSVRRVVRKIHIRTGAVGSVTKEIPTIVIDFTDGPTESLPSLGDLAQLDRIEGLLRGQMTTGSAPQRRAS